MPENGILSEELEKEIRREMEKAPHPRGACLTALKAVEDHHGWVSDDHLLAIARLLEMTPEEVESNASFYNLIYRKAVGRHVILVCESITCWIVGYEEILDYLCRKLGIEMGGTTSDERFTLLPIPCLGACDCAPVIMIDEDLHCRLTVDQIDGILARYP